MAEAGKPRVVVVGGGIGGALLAKTMEPDADVVLLDPKDYLEITWAELRSTVEPSFAERSLIYHRDYLTTATIVTSSAVSITEHAVLTADGQSLAYDYLVVATGHVFASAGSRTERLTEFQRDNEKIKSSESVLIIGGGPTGVELAAEIAVDYPEKKVTLVHRGSRLLDFIDQKASKKCLDWLTSKKVDVLFQQSVDLKSLSDTEKFYKTSAGETITADCHFVCIGKPLSSSWLHDTILKESLDTKGRIMVEKDLRVKGYNNIFAIGDITDIPEIKQGYLAQKHALLVAKNLKLLIKGAPPSKLATYSTGFPLAIVSLGRKEGLAQLPYLTLTGCIPGMLKSKDLFVGKTRKQMGLNA
ncbi:apoptosis-inducing factor homolog B-like [Triticum urartu]|uniref:FAD/NAD(P)-binding domain-containing protein n=2 Tax=Triticum urartu TaxID=4572 RepID=A0A8R7QPE4_TRIUA|nr:apoptosis-inducing factor homolog B-like [Triticum dicoccoides]XP_048536256.1 apoptosis-inducing factor homolog B-like [Triticum urartu]